MDANASGLFISIEGGDGAGKSTQAALLERRLRAEGWPVLLTHEPGGVPLGDYIRSWVKSEDAPLTPEAELLLFAASRAELVNRVIRPALAQGAVVIADRYADSTTAYQGGARGLSVKSVRAANEIATGGVWPRRTLLLDMPLAEIQRRVQMQFSFDETGRIEPPARVDDPGERRFELLGSDFHRRVAEAYRRLAKAEPERWTVLDGARPVEEVAEDVYARVRELLAGPPPNPNKPAPPPA